MFGMSHRLVNTYQDCSNYAASVKITPPLLSSYKKTYNIF